MSYVLLDSENIVIQKSDQPQEGFLEVPDNVYCGMIRQGNEFVNPPVQHRFTPIEVLRMERNRRLARTDWMSFPDSPTMSAEWTTYRQALRDLPSTASPSLDENGNLTGVTWPTKPE